MFQISHPVSFHHDAPDHGRIEVRKIWTTTELNQYLDFPHVAQAFMIQRETTNKKTGEDSSEFAYGITSQTPEQANPELLLSINRGHWAIENECHYIIDWNYDEDRSRIRLHVIMKQLPLKRNCLRRLFGCFFLFRYE